MIEPQIKKIVAKAGHSENIDVNQIQPFPFCLGISSIFGQKYGIQPIKRSSKCKEEAFFPLRLFNVR